MIKVLSVFGTRPEAIKMCPLVKELEKAPFVESVVCLTGQHKEMLQQVMDIFSVNADYNLNVMQKQQTLYTITSNIITGLEDVLEKENPNIVLVHGDTTTAFTSALAAFYKKIDVGHVEAGLRTYDIYSPFPEEMNRKLISNIAKFHFSPTENNKNNLLKEGITENIFVTGNTVIDAFNTTVRENYTFTEERLNTIDFENKKVVLLTAHRRENLGKPLENICNAVNLLTKQFNDIQIVCPVHLNPAVRNVIYGILGNNSNVLLVDPIDVMDMHNLLSKCHLVLTDSGGLQEEAPHFGIPVLVLREETERPEAVNAGTVKIVGTDENNILNSASLLLNNEIEYGKMSSCVNPYGDGCASKRILDVILDAYK